MNTYKGYVIEEKYDRESFNMIESFSAIKKEGIAIVDCIFTECYLEDTYREEGVKSMMNRIDERTIHDEIDCLFDTLSYSKNNTVAYQFIDDINDAGVLYSDEDYKGAADILNKIEQGYKTICPDCEQKNAKHKTRYEYDSIVALRKRLEELSK